MQRHSSSMCDGHAVWMSKFDEWVIVRCSLVYAPCYFLSIHSWVSRRCRPLLLHLTYTSEIATLERAHLIAWWLRSSLNSTEIVNEEEEEELDIITSRNSALFVSLHSILITTHIQTDIDSIFNVRMHLFVVRIFNHWSNYYCKEERKRGHFQKLTNEI